MRVSLGLVLATALHSFDAAAEPPDKPELVCTVSSQRAGDGMSLEVRFANETEADLSLGPGPHLVWYRDAAMQEPMDHTARANRLQNAPLVVPPKSTRVALYAIESRAMDEMRCNPAPPAGAALYFYQFSQRPQFRCVLQGYDLQAQTSRSGCRPSSPFGQGPAGK